MSTTSIVTISAIKADVGGFVGHSAVHPDLLSQAQRRVGEAVAERLLIDGAVDSCGDDVDLMHERWESPLLGHSELTGRPTPRVAVIEWRVRIGVPLRFAST